MSCDLITSGLNSGNGESLLNIQFKISTGLSSRCSSRSEAEARVTQDMDVLDAMMIFAGLEAALKACWCFSPTSDAVLFSRSDRFWTLHLFCCIKTKRTVFEMQQTVNVRL